MKAYDTGGHYAIIVAIDELRGLSMTGLEAKLQTEDGDGLDKKVALCVGGDDDVEFIPDDAEFDGLKEINITLSEQGYGLLCERDMYVIRVGGGSSIDVSVVPTLEDYV